MTGSQDFDPPRIADSPTPKWILYSAYVFVGLLMWGLIAVIAVGIFLLVSTVA